MEIYITFNTGGEMKKILNILFRIIISLCCVYFIATACVKFANGYTDGGFFFVIGLGFAFVAVMLKLASK